MRRGVPVGWLFMYVIHLTFILNLIIWITIKLSIDKIVTTPRITAANNCNLLPSPKLIMKKTKDIVHTI